MLVGLVALESLSVNTNKEEDIMARIRVMSMKGDEEFAYDVSDDKAVALARQKFDEFSAKALAAFKMDGANGEKITAFDPNAEEILFVSPYAGG